MTKFIPAELDIEEHGTEMIMSMIVLVKNINFLKGGKGGLSS